MSSYYPVYLDMINGRDNVLTVLTILAVVWVAGWWLLPRLIKDNNALLETSRISYSAIFLAVMLMIISMFVRLSHG